jgi:hypothetical protein
LSQPPNAFLVPETGSGLAFVRAAVVIQNALDHLVREGATMSNFLNIIRNEQFPGLSRIYPKVAAVDQNGNSLLHRKIMKAQEVASLGLV